jgi:hypothetical protein
MYLQCPNSSNNAVAFAQVSSMRALIISRHLSALRRIDIEIGNGRGKGDEVMPHDLLCEEKGGGSQKEA